MAGESYVLKSYVTGETACNSCCLHRSLGDQSLLDHLLSTACSGLVSLPSVASGQLPDCGSQEVSRQARDKGPLELGLSTLTLSDGLCWFITEHDPG